jgi:hypothetical protein
MGTILEALAVIKAKDATGGQLDAVANKVNRIARAANALNRDVQKQLNMARFAETHVARLERSSSAIGRGVKVAASAAAAYGVGHAATQVARETVRVSADREHEKTRMTASGMSASEIKEAGEFAGAISRKYPALSQTEIMHSLRNARSIVGSFEEAAEIIDPLMKLKVVALGAHPEKADELNEQFDQLIKGEEMRGITQNLPRFWHGMDVMAKALNVFGDTLRPTDFYETVKYSRQAMVPLSDKFMLETAPTLAQEMKGSSTGKALSTFFGTIVGGKMKNVAADEFDKFGLVNPGAVTRTKTGSVKGIKPHGIVGGDLAASDPYAWVNEVFLPALASHGVTDPKDIQTEIATMFRDTTAAQLVAVLATQQKRIEKDWGLIHGAKGLDSADNFLKSDPKVLQKAVGAQFENILANTTEPMMPAITGGMGWVVSAEAWAAEHAKKRPGDTAAAGVWGSALLSALGVEGGMAAAGHFGFGPGSKFLFSKIIGALAPMLTIAQIADFAFDDDDINRLKRYEAGPRSRFDRLHEIDRADGNLPNVRRESWLGQKVDAMRAEHDAERAKIESELAGFGYNPAITSGRYQGQGAPTWTIDDIRKATGLGGSGEPVEAKVVGEATLKTVVEVSPSSDFIARIRQEVQNAINAFRSSGSPATGTAGSTGRSMPEAVAGP